MFVNFQVFGNFPNFSGFWNIYSEGIHSCLFIPPRTQREISSGLSASVLSNSFVGVFFLYYWFIYSFIWRLPGLSLLLIKISRYISYYWIFHALFSRSFDGDAVISTFSFAIMCVKKNNWWICIFWLYQSLILLRFFFLSLGICSYFITSLGSSLSEPFPYLLPLSLFFCHFLEPLLAMSCFGFELWFRKMLNIVCQFMPSKNL